MAVEKFRTATVLLPTNALAFNYLGLACHQAGQTAEAAKAYQRALALERDLAEVHYNLGCLWLGENKLDQAKAELTAYTLRKPNSPDGWLRLGTAQLRAREVALAEKSFGEALRILPMNPEALSGLGLARLQRNRPGEAAQFFTRALKEQPDYRPALLNLAIVARENLNDQQLALQKFQEYLALKPPPENSDKVKALVTQIEQDLAQRPVVVAQAPQPAPAQARAPVLQEKPPPPTPRTTTPEEPPANPPKPLQTHPPKTATSQPAVPKSIAAANQPKPSPSVPAPAAVEVARPSPDPVVKAAPDSSASSNETTPPGQSPTASTAEGATKPAKRGFFQKINPANLFAGDKSTPPGQSGQGASPAPRYAYRQPATPVPGNRLEAERFFSEGVQAQRTQRLKDAIQAYRRSTQLDPYYYDAFYNLALALTEAGNAAAALVAYENALAIRPESQDARYNFALLLKQNGYVADAVNELERILAVHPGENRAHLALGNLYAQQLRQPAKARAHYLKVIESEPQHPQAAAIRYWLADHPR